VVRVSAQAVCKAPRLTLFSISEAEQQVPVLQYVRWIA
jgi:hypothetical protein